MLERLGLPILIGPILIVVVVIVGGLTLGFIRSGSADQFTVGLTAEAALESPDGDPMGTVTFQQASAGVLVMADVIGLATGGHAFIIHETGACTPDFSYAGDHFNPEDVEHGFIHAGWNRDESVGAHGGDLPNIYAASDGSARADFFTDGITLDTGPRHSVFDDDGSAIIVHEGPDSYGEVESDTGDRLACGVIVRK